MSWDSLLSSLFAVNGESLEPINQKSTNKSTNKSNPYNAKDSPHLSGLGMIERQVHQSNLVVDYNTIVSNPRVNKLVHYPYDGDVDFGRKISFEIKHNCADLMDDYYIQIKLPFIEGIRWVDDLEYSLIKYIELIINGVSINILLGEYLKIRNELYVPLEKRLDNIFYEIDHNGDRFQTLLIKIPFFEEEPLPLILMEYSMIKVQIEFSNLVDVLIPTKNNTELDIIPDIHFESVHQIINYIYLSDKSKEKYLSKKDLIYYMPFNRVMSDIGSETTDKYQQLLQLKINFDGYLKDICFVINDIVDLENNDYFKFGVDGVWESLRKFQLKILGYDTSYEYIDSHILSNVIPLKSNGFVPTHKGIYQYSFTNGSPISSKNVSGFLNMRFIDSLILNIQTKKMNGIVNVYGNAHSYLTIINGSCGVYDNN